MTFFIDKILHLFLFYIYFFPFIVLNINLKQKNTKNNKDKIWDILKLYNIKLSVLNPSIQNLTKEYAIK